MLLSQIHLQDFRNIEFATLKLDGSSHFFLGANAQGKTNLIESIGLVTALRSFRIQDFKTLLRHGASEAQVRYVFEHEREG